jgi:large subunit ribosomal protein L5
MQTIKEKYDKIAVPGMMKKFGYKNKLAVPRIVKVSISTGTGSLKDKTKEQIIEKSMAVITGQKAKFNPAKKSIAAFKLREGMKIGYSVMLRGQRMHDFLDRLVNVAIPRIRDFRGLNAKAVDSMGNFTIGLKEHNVFPETSEEDLKNVFGLGVTIVTSAKNKEEATELFKLLGFPFSKK